MEPPKQPISNTNGIKKPTIPSGIPKPGSGIPTMTPIRKIPSLDIKSLQSSNSTNDGYLPRSTTTTIPKPTLSKLPQVPLQSNIDIKAASETQKSSVPTIPKPVVSQIVKEEPQQAVNEPQTSTDNKENEGLKLKVKDLEEKLETLKVKRAEDRDKLREYEKSKLQIQQLQEFKLKAQQEISDLNKELVQAKQDAKTLKEQFDGYKEEMSEVETRIEETTVDKELAEARVEELQDEINRLNDKVEELQLELDVLKGEIETNGVDGAAASFQLKQNEKEQERLKAALIKLRDISVQDKAELNSIRKVNEELNTKIKSLQKDFDNLKAENTDYMSQIVELKDQVTATLGSVQMIEQLTEQNLDLEQKVLELQETIADLEAINEVNDQLQENAREEERELRQNLDMAESRIREYEKSIEALKYTIADHEKTIVRYRDVVKTQQNENDSLQRQLQSKLEEERQQSTQANTSANFDFKVKLIENKNYAKIIECESNKIEILNYKKHINYLLSFMNEQFLKRGGDHDCVLTVLLFKRLMDKCDFILKEVKEKFPIVDKLTKEDVTKSHVANQCSYSSMLSMLISYVQLISSRFDKALNSCSLSKYNDIGSMSSELLFDEKSLDSLIDLLQKSQLDETISLESIERACLHLQAVFNNHLSEEQFDNKSLVDYLSKFGQYISDSISIEIQRLQLLTQSKDFETSSEIIVLFKEIYNSNEDIKLLFKKLHKLIPTDEKKLLLLNTEFIQMINSCIKSSFSLVKVLNLMCTNANDNSLIVNENNDGISAKKLEDLAYQACDQVYFRDDTGPYDNMRVSINTIVTSLNKLSIVLENGDFEKEMNATEQKTNAPILLAAESFKNTLIEAETLKYKLEGKDEEIKELKKHLKFKNDELSETKVRFTLMEKKYEVNSKESEEKIEKLQASLDEFKEAKDKFEKEHADTLEALQQEVDTLQTEKRDLKDKLRQLTAKAMVSRQTNEILLKSPTDCSTPRTLNAPSFESHVYLEEITLLKSQIKLLEDTINELRVEKVKNQMETLSKLPPIKNITVGKIEDEKMKALQKESNNLIKDFYSSIIDFKVPNLKEKDGKKAKTDINLQTNIQFKHLSKNANELQAKINQTMANLVPGSHIKTPISVFQAPEYSKLNQLKNNQQLVAEIRLPCKNGSGKTIDLTLNHNEIKDIFRMVSAM